MFVMDFIFGVTGGTENQVVKIISNLDQGRYDLYLLCLHSTPWLSANSKHLRCSVQAFDYNVFNHKDPRNLIAFLRSVQHIRKVCPDIVVTFFPTSYILGVFAARLGRVRHIIGTRRDFGLWLNQRTLPFIRFANRFVERIVTNSAAVKEITAREEGFDESAIDVIYNGIDMKEINSVPPADVRLRGKLGIPSDRKIVGISAGLRQMKRHRTFLLAAQRVIKVRQDVHFLLVGDGPMRNELEALSSQLGLAGYATFTGWQEDVRPFLSLLDVGVNCSANEGLSNAVMEYMARGVPCIVSAAGGNPELIEHGVSGYLFPLDDSAVLADFILKMLADDLSRHIFSVNAKRVIASRFALDRMISEYSEYFAKIMTASGFSVARDDELVLKGKR